MTTDGYTEPENGTVFTWTNTNTPVSSDSEIRRDMDNKIKITVPTATNEPFTNKATADKKKVKITANGTYTKVYDGTTCFDFSKAGNWGSFKENVDHRPNGAGTGKNPLFRSEWKC